jgi:endonuclease/exonuclease/phosphatase family metal-dependent hydrolase
MLAGNFRNAISRAMTRLLRYTLLGLLIVIGVVCVMTYSLTWRPEAREIAPVACSTQAPGLAPGQALKVMTWNVQYLAGKRYVFWNDLAAGTDDSPTPEDMAFSLDEVARVIRDEQPDVVLLQELDDGAKASDYQNQLKLLQERLADLYPCSAHAFDWKADFVPNPHIFGSVGRQLATLSRYRIEHAERLQLPIASANPISRQFQPKNALLVTYLPLSDGGQLAVLNTHLERATQPDETLQAQVAAMAKVLDKFESRGTPWLIGGDFNLLPLGQYQRLPSEQRTPYSADSALHLLWDKYPMIPTNNESSGIDRARWLTHYPNDAGLNGPDRTVDYLFFSPRIKRVEATVRQDDTLRISDHLPVIARFLLPAAP